VLWDILIDGILNQKEMEVGGRGETQQQLSCLVSSPTGPWGGGRMFHDTRAVVLAIGIRPLGAASFSTTSRDGFVGTKRRKPIEEARGAVRAYIVLEMKMRSGGAD
jgi:hypothetical protein